MSSTLSRPWFKSSTLKLLVIGLLSVLIVVSALPRYVSDWPWAAPLKVPNQSALQAMRDEGLSLPGWQTEDQVRTDISNNSWSIQELSAVEPDAVSALTDAKLEADRSLFLLLRPQVWEADHPEVEWVDIKGSQRWQTDSQRRLSVQVPVEPAANTDQSEQNSSETVRIYPDYFRAWNQGQTFAVLQWYAWPGGGTASASSWFWGDQKAQWTQRQRLPWVAVHVWLPVEPLSQIDVYEEFAAEIAGQVQSRLEQTVFAGTDGR